MSIGESLFRPLPAGARGGVPDPDGSPMAAGAPKPPVLSPANHLGYVDSLAVGAL